MPIGTPVTLGSTLIDSSVPTDLTHTHTTTANAPAGSLMVALISTGENFVSDLSSVTSPNATWTIHCQVDDFIGMAIASAPAVSQINSGEVITFTYAGGSEVYQSAIQVLYVTGCDTSGTRTTGTASAREDDNATINSASWTGQPITTAVADAIVLAIASAGDNDFASTNSSTGGGFTEFSDLGHNGDGWGGTAIFYRIVSATGTYTPSGAWNNVQNNGGAGHATVAFKQGVGGGPSQRFMWLP